MQNDEIQPNRMNFWHVPLSFWKPHLLKHIQEKNIIFCVIRNPYERIVSIYNFWLSWYNGSFKYKNKVVILVSHRLSAIRKCEKIIILKTNSVPKKIKNFNNSKSINYFKSIGAYN